MTRVASATQAATIFAALRSEKGQNSYPRGRRIDDGESTLAEQLSVLLKRGKNQRVLSPKGREVHIDEKLHAMPTNTSRSSTRQEA